MTTFAIIPARGGSVGVPRKNLRIIAGIPLIAHILRAAKASSETDMVFVSTEDDEIAHVAHAEGAAVIRHPTHLSEGSRASFGVIKHAVRQWKKAGLPDMLVMLRATTPLTTSADIDGAIRVLRSHPQADSVVGVSETRVHPHRVYRIDKKGRLIPFDRLHAEQRYPRRRQTFSEAYVRTAGLYVTRPDIVLGGSLWGDVVLPHLVPRERAVNINDELDFRIAEMLLKERP